MTAIALDIVDLATSEQRNFNIDTSNPVGRLFGRWLVRELPGNFELAKHFYPDDVPVIERLNYQSTQGDFTVTQCKGGVPHLIYPRRFLGTHDHVVDIPSESYADHFDEEDEKARLFKLLAAEIREAARFLHPDYECSGMAEFDAQHDNLIAVIEKAATATRMLGDAYKLELKLLLVELRSEIVG